MKIYDCPYCYESLPSPRELRRHVGKVHQDKLDDFTYTYHGGRLIPPKERA